MDGSFDFKLVGTAGGGGGLGADVLQGCGEAQILQGTDGDVHGHPHVEASHVCLVDVAAEDELAHVCHGGNGGTVVEGVAENDRVTYLDGDVQDDATDGAAHKGIAAAGIAGGYTVAGEFQLLLCHVGFLAGLVVGLTHLLIVVGRNQTFVIKGLLAFIIDLGLFQIEL